MSKKSAFFKFWVWGGAVTLQPPPRWVRPWGVAVSFTKTETSSQQK
jgi:hypothetical protein